MIIIQAAQDIHLQGIYDLQKKNLPVNLSSAEIIDEGFVTIDHDLALLKDMNDILPHTIALDKNRVIGYALAMDKSFSQDVPFLVSLFDRIESFLLKNNPQDPLNYIVMGQVCIDKEYRSQGIFLRMFENLKERLSGEFDSIFTDIAVRNTRSLRAHHKIGFQSIEIFEINNDTWSIVQWKW